MRNSHHKAGFSLIEVNLAIMMIAVGLLALFSLFPLGLRESEAGMADTQEAMFADTILSALEGDAITMTNWYEWATTNAFEDAVTRNLRSLYPALFLQDPADPLPIEFPKDSGKYIRYHLSVDCIDKDDPSRWRATLRVMAGEYGSFDNASVFFTEFIYLGM